ncbi:MAG: undecaprenyl-diphosphate phosphatase [Xanthomonadales bacterium]|nr:undecaprenyl-diphosphate phosphatase [Xanthomonadales bacterium]
MTLHVLLLAVVQGLTEFLPVSSSAHLILASWLLDWKDQGLVIDVAIHSGTLFAVLVYFRRDWLAMLEGAQRERLIQLLIASLPVIATGALLHELIGSHLRNARVIAIATLVFGLLLWLADAIASRRSGLGEMTRKRALLIGLAQVLALIPGASRSGVTITMARYLGFSAGASARFSFLLAVPVLAGAGLWGFAQMWQNQVPTEWGTFGLAMAASAVTGWACIGAFLWLLERVGLRPFIFYRLLLGAILLLIVI